MNELKKKDVLLVHMPFGTHYMPSLALSLLKEAVKKKGYSSIIKYYSLKYAKLIGDEIYHSISLGKPAYRFLFGEWIFSGALFDNFLPDEKYITDILRGNRDQYLKSFPNAAKVAEELIDLIPEIKRKTEPFINSCLEEIISIRPKVAGFSTIYQQNTASLSLAKRVKENLPETTVVFGGANCEGEMGVEIIKKFPFVDIVVSGEADETFPELVSNIISKTNYSLLQGVICRENLHIHSDGVINSPMIADMDSLPVPDYDDYFEEVKNYSIKGFSPRPVLLFESSRGCWWGEKSHCTFCGLNRNNMLHRSKSASRVINEIKFLRDKYKVNEFEATDNILDLSYFKDFIPALANENLKLGLFYEVKANLTKEQLKLLKAANINSIQPGIESFSTHVLGLMKKGVRGIQNVQLLKWCKELGIKVRWNIIFGFPGETKDDYYEMADLIPKISHLDPPSFFLKLRLDRFSPNFNFPEKFGLKNIRPVSSYYYIYAFEEESLKKLAYFFDYEYDADNNFDFALDAAKNEIARWKSDFREIDLFFSDQKNALVIFDLRQVAQTPYFILYAKERFIYLLCDGIKPFTRIKNEYSKFFETEANETEINSILDSLIDKNLMIRENKNYLSLAVPMGNYLPNKEVMKKLFMILKNQPEGDNRVMITNNNQLVIKLRTN